jgi:ornithine cyclodeaminase/alanine dehydrogenase-like protein (mu-crystallin family)
MRIITGDEVGALLDDRALIEALRAMFVSGCVLPDRHHHAIPAKGQDPATLLVMPAWQTGGPIGVKLVTVFPGNGARGLPAVMGNYMLLDGETGAPLALIDGPALTAHRTAGASALAAGYLAAADASRLLMVGTGALAPHLIAGHASVRRITRVDIWGRTPDKAEALARSLDREGLMVRAVTDLAQAAKEADIISCATLAKEPLIEGAWLRAGQHLDLVGGFTPEMREADDEAVRRSTVFVDTLAGATKEAGDITQPLASGALRENEIAGDLFALTRGTCKGRTGADEITFFKSVGTALEDLAAAQLVVEKLGGKDQ